MNLLFMFPNLFLLVRFIKSYVVLIDCNLFTKFRTKYDKYIEQFF